MSRCLVAIFTAVALVIASAYADGKGPTSAHDPYLERAGAEWDSLFNAGNYDALMSLYAADAVAYPPNAPTLTGYDAIKADYDQFRAAYTAHKELHVDEILTGDNWAVERSHYTLHLTPKSGGGPITETGRWIVCRKKINGQWKIAWEIWNTDVPAK